MSAAILFYGYNLGAPDDSGWAVEDEETVYEEWCDGATVSGQDYMDAMRSHLLVKAGLMELRDFTSFDAAQKVIERHGVEIVSYGHSNTTFYGLALAGTVYRADDWSPAYVTPTSNGNAARLRMALELLNMKPTQRTPSWILAPQED